MSGLFWQPLDQIDPAKYQTIDSGFGILFKEQGIRAIADVALCPFEAVKVRVQTQPGFARGLSDGLPKLIKSVLGLYKGIVPLWGPQIPCKQKVPTS
ncbi:Mitochondrial phosphate carrier protein 2, mitochondrial-like protein [Drosera capensis]